jgi:hypothetical protein
MFSLTGVRKFDLSSFVLFATFVMCICSHTFFKSITTDNVLVAYMMAMTGKKELAYSSLIQVVRSRTAKGFVPNFSAGGAKSQDR